MLVQITLDKIDGSKSKVVDTDLEDVSMRDLMFMLMNADSIGITITKKNVLRKLETINGKG